MSCGTLFCVSLYLSTQFPIRGIRELQGLLTHEEYLRIKNFVYLKSEEEVEAFSCFIEGLCIEKVTSELLIVL